MKKIWIMAGESSGDMYGAQLAGQLRSIAAARGETLEISGMGGEAMIKAGIPVKVDSTELGVIGIFEVLKSIFTFIRIFFQLVKAAKAERPDAVVMIDYPGFNLKVAKFAKEHNFKVVYYIPPKVWARGASRIKLLKKYVDATYIIFPFEVEYFKKKGLDVRYFGNPLIDNISNALTNYNREEFLQRHSLEEKPIIALLAGSRKMEIEYLLPRMKEVVRLMNAGHKDKYQFVLAAAPSHDLSYYKQIIGDCPIKVIQNETYAILKSAQAAIISSGTASLEAAIISTPQVVCYGMHPITYFIAKLVVKLESISLASMILGKPIFKELLQDKCTPENIAEEVLKLTENESYRNIMMDDYKKMNDLLGEKGSIERIAQDIEQNFRKQ
jgi:lipid-A-disaccharide synthase